MPLENSPSARAVAERFLQYLESDIANAKDYSRLCLENLVEPNRAVCHSHSFVNADGRMGQSILDVTGDTFDFESESDVLLRNSAWAVAKGAMADLARDKLLEAGKAISARAPIARATQAEVHERYRQLIFPAQTAWPWVHANKDEVFKKEYRNLLHECGDFADRPPVISEVLNTRLHTALSTAWPLVNTIFAIGPAKAHVSGALVSGNSVTELWERAVRDVAIEWYGDAITTRIGVLGALAATAIQMRSELEVVDQQRPDVATSRHADPVPHTERPLAAPGLLSYRCKGAYDWIMIGAKDDDDAMVQALLSSQHAKREDLQKWNGSAYVPCLDRGRDPVVAEQQSTTAEAESDARAQIFVQRERIQPLIAAYLSSRSVEGANFGGGRHGMTGPELSIESCSSEMYQRFQNACDDAQISRGGGGMGGGGYAYRQIAPELFSDPQQRATMMLTAFKEKGELAYPGNYDLYVDKDSNIVARSGTVIHAADDTTRAMQAWIYATYGTPEEQETRAVAEFAKAKASAPRVDPGMEP